MRSFSPCFPAGEDSSSLVFHASYSTDSARHPLSELSECPHTRNVFPISKQRASMDAKIVVNAEILSPSFVPESVIHREKEIALVSGDAKNGVNTFIFGPPGCGKTAILKKVCLEASSTERRAVYIDCS